MALKTDYKNDILDESMIGRRRFKVINNDDGTVSFTDQTQYTQRGDFLDAEDLNKINKAVNNLNDSDFVKLSDVTSIDDEEINSLFEQ